MTFFGIVPFKKSDSFRFSISTFYSLAGPFQRSLERPKQRSYAKFMPSEVGLPIYHFGVNETIGVSSCRVVLGFFSSMIYVKRPFGLIVSSLVNACSQCISSKR